MAFITYQNFDLLIERTELVYRASLNSPAGEETTTFDEPFSDREVKEFLTAVGRSRQIDLPADSLELEAKAKNFGSQFFTRVFDRRLYSRLTSSLEITGLQGNGLRIRLRLTRVPELADLPWEYLYNRDLNSFLALSSETPVVRYMEMPRRIQPLTIESESPLRILVVISNPTDLADRNLQPIDVEQEWAKLNNSLQDLRQQGRIVLEPLEKATPSSLRQRLRREDVHILHYIGHGGFDEKAEDGILILSDEENRSCPISGELLGMHLHDHRPLRLVVLNACEGARGSRTDPFRGTAQSLVQQGIPAVIAMQFEITDDAAITFAAEFYGAMADYYPVDAALAQARLAIRAEDNNLEWGTPALYMRSPDGRIFAKEHEQETRERRDLSRVPDTDPMEVHYRTVVEGLAKGEIVPFLGIDANQCGRPEGTPWGRGHYLPSAEELAAHLVSQFSRQFPPPAGVRKDLLRSLRFVGMNADSRLLYAHLHAVFDADYPPTPLHTLLAKLPGTLRDKGYPARYQMIVTVNYDDLLERAFSDAGVPYDLVTYEAEGEQRGKFFHWIQENEAILIEKPNQYQAFSLDQRAVILKIHGAVDRTNSGRDSYVITEDHHLDYSTRTDISNLLPVELANILRKSHFLFLGSRLPECHLRVIFHRIWREQKKLVLNSWAVPLNCAEVDEKFWLNRNVDTIPVNLERYIEELGDHVAMLTRTGGAV